jgi:RNA polymerase sigma-32 factor
VARKTGKARKPRSTVTARRGRPHDAIAPIDLTLPIDPTDNDAIETQAEVTDEEPVFDSSIDEQGTTDELSDEAVAATPVRDPGLDVIAHGDVAIDEEIEPHIDPEIDTDDADPAGDDVHPIIALPGIDGTAPDRNVGADGGSLVPFDPLSRYLAEIRRFPLLSRENETVISKRYAKFHDPEDAYRLVTANLRLVVKIANEFARATRNLLDLIQEGNIGLMEAVKHFNPEVGIRFPSYAVWWVRAYIYRYLINNWRLVKIGTTQAQRKLFFNLRKESERLEAEGFSAQPKLLAQRMGVKESEVREMQERMSQSEVSLDQPASADDDTSLMDALPDSSSNPEEAAARAQWREFAHEKVEEFAGTLEGKELEIFRSRLLTEDPPTLQEMGVKFGISRERVRQIESRLKRRFKAFLKLEGDDFGDASS